MRPNFLLSGTPSTLFSTMTTSLGGGQTVLGTVLMDGHHGTCLSRNCSGLNALPVAPRT